MEGNRVLDNKSYRKDIDGLRAVAVLSVILFHINENIIPGGFVGVDVFFVISGYLISLHIFKDLNLKRFSILEFYRRRVKRIMPAMLVVVLSVVVISQVILLPNDAERVAESSLWSLLSMANVYFWLFEDASYFAAASNQKPLLHLWSLGIEEQFYLFWPLILLATYRIGQGKYFFSISCVIAIISFCAGEYYFGRDPSFVYYMLPTRAGELLVGALAAQIVIKRGEAKLPLKVVSFIGLLGSVLVLQAFFFLSEDVIFPGLQAMPPTIGTAMIILAGHFGNSLPSRLLKLRPLVWMGLISYSAYLWHWPLLAFYRYGNSEISLLAGSFIFVVTILLAWLSYHYVETPCRRSRLSATPIFIRQYILPTAVIAFLALVSMKIDGYGFRWISDDYKSELAALRDESLPAFRYDYVCLRNTIKQDEIDNEKCVLKNGTDTDTSVILWGDSNAAHYIGIIGEFAKEGGFNFRNLQIGACPPIDGDPTEFVGLKRTEDCKKSGEMVFNAIKDYPVVIVSASWPSYQARSSRFMRVFFDTAQSLADQGKLVIILGKAPIISKYDRLCREKQISYPFISCKISSVSLVKKVTEVNERLKEFSENKRNIEYYDFNEYLCPNDSCSLYDEFGKVMYYDSSHLSLPASWRVGKDIVRQDGIPYPFSKIAGLVGEINSAHRSEIGNYSNKRMQPDAAELRR